tara:strand:- start:1148 stop:1642 length:495 start_codon:yes stop_codon:yes gene_type:complete
MGGKNMTAKIYLLEDINDNRYVGSTSEVRLENRLATHKRDQKEFEFGVRKGGCSSMGLDLHYTTIILLEEVENKKEIRSQREKHYINNVYPESVNKIRFGFDKNANSRKYYANNKEKVVARNKKCKAKNKEKYNKTRRAYYDKNKEKINARRRELREMKRLENL